MNSAYVDKNLIMVDDRSKILKKYLLSWNFSIDLLAALPFDTINNGNFIFDDIFLLMKFPSNLDFYKKFYIILS
jgi:hypothetical protein